ncbi:Cu(I)/Ag(I) efflux system membrane fusion protein [Mucilaginibacter gracilis]|uniref:Cu(I)/Ag(I) efflux system membrane fusion protein n=1 Tax=Mucilaginibacter gracilis TaxID=423350 RepID=A0A495J4C1_9SPHI|nr:efflux RND transporter periplasmic adaptor subunit [Mucilaginibacter gracilis]RKR83673.1 Cu(I)/Ag(I) efflux system membrane fusion protein [Mucilaginibacter gracilis]
MKGIMKRINIFFALLLTITLALTACQNNNPASNTSAAKADVKYTCPMHSQIIEDHAGSCPICGMTLVKTSGQASEGAGISLNTVLQPVNGNVISSVSAITPVEKVSATQISADGYLDFDTRTFNNIASRFSGRIEKLYIKYAFQEIHAGQRIFDIYSADMVTAQQDMLYISKNSPQETGLLHAAIHKLLLQGMTNQQVNQVIKNNKPFYSLPVYSAYEGHVHDVAHSQMDVATETKPVVDFANNLPLAVKQGMYVTKGQILFNVVNPHSLWAIVKIDLRQAGALKLNQPVKLTLPDMPGMLISGRVNFIEPTLQNGDKTTSIRVYLNNMNHELKVNALVKASIQTGSINGLWIPKAALIDLGSTKIVWLKQGASYKAHEVNTGIEIGNSIQITKGLAATDSVAANAQYLADSESFIKIKKNE